MTTIDQIGRGHDDRGLYTTKSQSEPEVRLETNDEGTFLFPPANYSSTAEYAKFWLTTPISDGVLSNISLGYADLVRRQLAAESGEWGRAYDARNAKDLHHENDGKRASAREAREEAYDDFVESWHEERPERIPSDYARTIARAGQLYYNSSSLDADGAAEVLSSTFAVRGGDRSVEYLADRYQLHAIREYFQSPETTTAERIEELRAELAQLD